MGTKRLIVLDHNLSGIGGHFAELASVIIEGGAQAGFEPWLVTHKDLNIREIRAGGSGDPAAKMMEELSQEGRILPAFTVSKMHRWSLATSGHSRLSRNAIGTPRSAGLKSRWQNVVDRMHRESPQWMMKQYSTTITQLCQKLKPTREDVILFATCEDLGVLSAASAIRELNADSALNLHFLFHTNLIDQRQGHWRHRGYCNREFVLQMEEAKRLLQAHHSHFWATTVELADQLNLMTDQYCLERKQQPTTFWHSIDYPVRQEFSPTMKSPGAPKRLVMGGKVRSEKGAREIRRLVDTIWDSQLASGQWQLYLQASQRESKRFLPRHAYKQTHLQDAVGQDCPIVFLENKLSAADYASLIHAADAGLFMYDPSRYYARCSGVLVEMLSAGIPVIVPSGCWLSRQIAGEFAKWVAQRNFGEVLYDSTTTQTICWNSPWHEFTFDVDDAQAIIVELHLVSQRSDDYVGFQFEPSSDRSLAQVNHCEVPADGPVRSCFQILGTSHRCKLRVGLPYRQRDLRLCRIVVRKTPFSKNPLNPTSSVGLTASSTRELPRLIQELGESYEHYRATAIEHSVEWRERHSGCAFIQRILSRQFDERK